MEKSFSYACLVAACIALLACGKQSPPSPPATSPAGSTSAPPSGSADRGAHPAAGITPASPDKPAESSTSTPGHGSTAIGGVVGNQDQGGANTKTPPAPTGGDAAPGSK